MYLENKTLSLPINPKPPATTTSSPKTSSEIHFSDFAIATASGLTSTSSPFLSPQIPCFLSPPNPAPDKKSKEKWSERESEKHKGKKEKGEHTELCLCVWREERLERDESKKNSNDAAIL